MTIVYDDAFNLMDARSYRCSIGFLLEENDKSMIEKFTKLGYQLVHLPKTKALYGTFPFRNKTSLTVAS